MHFLGHLLNIYFYFMCYVSTHSTIILYICYWCAFFVKVGTDKYYIQHSHKFNGWHEMEITFLKLLAMQILKSTIALLTFYLFSPTITIWTWFCYIFFLFNVFRRFCGLLILVKTVSKTKAICPTLHNNY